VAAVGWLATKDALPLASHFRSSCLATLGLSAIFGIFTLARIPLVQEQKTDHPAVKSVYRVPVEFWFWGLVSWFLPRRYKRGMFLTWVCFPQHVLFIAGVALYVIGALAAPDRSEQGIPKAPLTGMMVSEVGNSHE
jgi:hypothetical protein